MPDQGTRHVPADVMAEIKAKARTSDELQSGLVAVLEAIESGTASDLTAIGIKAMRNASFAELRHRARHHHFPEVPEDRLSVLADTSEPESEHEQREQRDKQANAAMDRRLDRLTPWQRRAVDAYRTLGSAKAARRLGMTRCGVLAAVRAATRRLRMTDEQFAAKMGDARRNYLRSRYTRLSWVPAAAEVDALPAVHARALVMERDHDDWMARCTAIGMANIRVNEFSRRESES